MPQQTAAAILVSQSALSRSAAAAAARGVRHRRLAVERVVLSTERLRLILETPEEAFARIEALTPSERAEVSPY
jgi:hypothetical protein